MEKFIFHDITNQNLGVKTIFFFTTTRMQQTKQEPRYISCSTFDSNVSQSSDKSCTFHNNLVSSQKTLFERGDDVDAISRAQENGEIVVFESSKASTSYSKTFLFVQPDLPLTCCTNFILIQWTRQSHLFETDATYHRIMWEQVQAFLDELATTSSNRASMYVFVPFLAGQSLKSQMELIRKARSYQEYRKALKDANSNASKDDDHASREEIGKAKEKKDDLQVCCGLSIHVEKQFESGRLLRTSRVLVTINLYDRVGLTGKQINTQ